MKILVILGFVCSVQLFSAATIPSSFGGAQDVFSSVSGVPEPEVVNQPEQDVATNSTNQARYYDYPTNNYYPPPPSPYQSPYPSPYQSPYPSPYQSPYPSPYQSPYQNPYPTQTSTQTSQPTYYKDPTGKLYNILPDGTFYDRETNQVYTSSSIPNTSGFGSNYIVAADGSTYTEVNGQRYRVDDNVSPDGNRYYTDRDGTRFYVNANGDPVYSLPDGTTYTTNSNGITVYTKPDGTMYFTDPNTGTTYTQPPGGDMYYTVRKYLDNTTQDVYTKDASGNTYRTRTDGSFYIKAANGCTYNVNGKVTTLAANNASTCPATFTGTSPENVTYTG